MLPLARHTGPAVTWLRHTVMFRDTPRHPPSPPVCAGVQIYRGSAGSSSSARAREPQKRCKLSFPSQGCMCQCDMPPVR